MHLKPDSHCRRIIVRAVGTQCESNIVILNNVISRVLSVVIVNVRMRKSPYSYDKDNDAYELV